MPMQLTGRPSGKKMFSHLFKRLTYISLGAKRNKKKLFKKVLLLLREIKKESGSNTVPIGCQRGILRLSPFAKFVFAILETAGTKWRS